MKTPVLVSAHRRETPAAIRSAAALGADFVEFDVRRLRDGRFIVAHDQPADAPATHGASTATELLGIDTLLDTLVELPGVGAHVDLKLGSPPRPDEVDGWLDVVGRAVDRLGAERVLVTTGRPVLAHALRGWARTRGVDLLVGLSVGTSLAGLRPRDAWRSLRAQLTPEGQLEASGAGALCAHHVLALLRLRRLARRRGLRLIVWTVDSRLGLRWWTRPGATWLVVTNDPETALRRRDGR
ncbi:MAG: glycerophosphodiester phosphodiesterase family protein [Nocardioides sp.]|uniref:glycerophosphodiester phosphodiesterase n=1 Tax=Nocardioides sp. TaxID=35761 RepID=UPI0039E43904